MTDYSGIRVIPRKPGNYVIAVDDKYYFWDKTSTLVGTFDTPQQATSALKLNYENELKEIS